MHNRIGNALRLTFLLSPCAILRCDYSEPSFSFLFSFFFPCSKCSQCGSQPAFDSSVQFMCSAVCGSFRFSIALIHFSPSFALSLPCSSFVGSFVLSFPDEPLALNNFGCWQSVLDHYFGVYHFFLSLSASDCPLHWLLQKLTKCVPRTSLSLRARHRLLLHRSCPIRITMPILASANPSHDTVFSCVHACFSFRMWHKHTCEAKTQQSSAQCAVRMSAERRAQSAERRAQSARAESGERRAEQSGAPQNRTENREYRTQNTEQNTAHR